MIYLTSFPYFQYIFEMTARCLTVSSLLRESLYHCFAPLTIGEFRTSLVVERKVKDGPPVRESRQLSQKREKGRGEGEGKVCPLANFERAHPLRFVCRRQSATEKIHFDLDWR